MPLQPPSSRSARIYETWLNGRPADADYLDMAYEYIDQTNDAFVAWKIDRGYVDPYGETDEEEAARARQIAQGWKDLGFTNGDVNNFLAMDPADRRALASDFARGRARNGNVDDLTDWERALYYHGGS